MVKYRKTQRTTGAKKCASCGVPSNYPLNVNDRHPRMEICDECLERKRTLGLAK